MNAASREAISYGRFSTGKQSDGDSEPRQERAYREVLASEKSLVESERFKFGNLFDRGLSGFKGKHLEEGHLGQLLALIRSGEIKAPSVIVIEQWSRFSRMAPDLAVRLLSEIVRSGVDIVVHNPRLWVTPAVLESWEWMGICAALKMAHGESKAKSDMILEAFATRRASGKRMKGNETSWLDWNEEKQGYVFNDDAPLLLRAVELSIAGNGQDAIRRTLGITGSKWSSLVSDIFTNRALVGEFQPMARSGNTTYLPIPDYYPSLLTEDKWSALQDSIDSRRSEIVKANLKAKKEGKAPLKAERKAPLNKRGKYKAGGKARGSSSVTNLFPNILFSAHDGSPLWIRGNDKWGRHLISKKEHQENNPSKRRIALPFVEESILLAFTDLDEADLFPQEANNLAEQIGALKGKIARLTEKIDRWKEAALDDSESGDFSDMVRAGSKQRSELAGQMDALLRERSKDVPDALRKAKDIIGYLANLTGDKLQDARVRLRRLLPQLIKRIDVHISGYRSASFRCTLEGGFIMEVDGGANWTGEWGAKGTVVVGERLVGKVG
jgi:hypothetical protein